MPTMSAQDSTPFTNEFNDLSEYLQTPPTLAITKNKCSKDTIFHTAFFFDTTSSVLSFILLCFLCVSGLIIYTDVTTTLVDAKDTLSDLNIILPEVHTTMMMLKHLCKTPEFKQYCFPEMTNMSTPLNVSLIRR